MPSLPAVTLWQPWASLVAEPGPLEFEPVPFDHPLWVLYSSGTTGLPKPIVQSQGGILLQHRAPFQSGGERRASPTAKSRISDFLDDGRGQTGMPDFEAIAPGRRLQRRFSGRVGLGEVRSRHHEEVGDHPVMNVVAECHGLQT